MIATRPRGLRILLDVTASLEVGAFQVGVV